MPKIHHHTNVWNKITRGLEKGIDKIGKKLKPIDEKIMKVTRNFNKKVDKMMHSFASSKEGKAFQAEGHRVVKQAGKALSPGLQRATAGLKKAAAEVDKVLMEFHQDIKDWVGLVKFNWKCNRAIAVQKKKHNTEEVASLKVGKKEAQVKFNELKAAKKSLARKPKDAVLRQQVTDKHRAFEQAIKLPRV